jgi:hypothetical protein
LKRDTITLSYRKASIVLSLCFIVGAIYLYSITFRWKPGTHATLPRLSLTMIILLNVLAIVQEMRRRGDTKNMTFSKRSLGRLLMAILITAIYIASIKVLGFYLSSLLFLTGMMFFVGAKGLMLTVGIPLVFTISLYVVFGLFLRVNVPTGMF